MKLGITILAGLFLGSHLLDASPGTKDPRRLRISAPARVHRRKAARATGVNLTIPRGRRKQTLMTLSGAGVVMSPISHLFPVLRPLYALTVSITLVPILRDAERSLIHERRVRSPTLNALSTSVCMATGHYLPAAIIALIVHCGDHLVKLARGNSQRIMHDLFRELPATTFVRVQGVEVRTSTTDLKLGDEVVVHVGEPIPADGVILEGTARIDQQALTGESQPAEKTPGERVFASTLVLGGRIVIQVQKTGEDTVVAEYTRLVVEAVAFKPPQQLTGEIWADKLAPSLLGGALLSTPVVGPYAGAALLNLSSATRIRIVLPLQNLSYLRTASRGGILVKSGAALEQLRQVKTVLFDKTGTLTDSTLGVDRVIPFHDCDVCRVVALAAAAEQGLAHPIAEAIVEHAQHLGARIPPREHGDYHLGMGVEVRIEGRHIRVGSPRFIAQYQPLGDHVQQTIQYAEQQGQGLILVSEDDRVLGGLLINAVLRPGVRALLSQLRVLGVERFGIISGDSHAATERVAAALGIEQVFAEVLPEQKADIVQRFQSQQGLVCYVGDGINDALAMQRADISVSLRGAASIATDSAQLILLDGHLDALADAFRLSRQLARDLDVLLVVSFLPGVVILGGVITFGWGVLASLLVGNLGLGGGVLYVLSRRHVALHRQQSPEMTKSTASGC